MRFECESPLGSFVACVKLALDLIEQDFRLFGDKNPDATGTLSRLVNKERS
jgi:hypothetical protein